jgi:putative ABC transport system permease protein
VPGAVGVGALFAPRVYIPARYLAETRLVQTGSRVDYEAYVRLPDPRAADPLVEQHRPIFRAERVSANTASEQQADMAEALGNLGSFLALIGTFALLLGGIGVASAMGAYMAQKRDTVATLRCLGATAPQVIVIYLLQAGAMGLIGAAAGTAIGVSVQWVLPRLLDDLLPVDVETAVSLPAVAMGIGIGVWVAVAFALLPLLATRRISPLEAIRRRVEAEPVKRRRDPWTFGGWLLLAASIVALVTFQARDLRTGLGFAAGIALTLGALWLSAWAMTRLARRAPTRGLPYPARQGVANLYRPGNQTSVVVLALGFGVWLLATVYLVQRNLLAPLQVNAESQGNLLLFDIQADQEQGVAGELGRSGTRVMQRAPIVPMRIHAINGVPASRLAPDDPDAEAEDAPEQRRPRQGERRASADGDRPERWAVRREYRSTFRWRAAGGSRAAAARTATAWRRCRWTSPWPRT